MGWGVFHFTDALQIFTLYKYPTNIYKAVPVVFTLKPSDYSVSQLMIGFRQGSLFAWGPKKVGVDYSISL